jgi:hypothetical protein
MGRCSWSATAPSTARHLHTHQVRLYTVLLLGRLRLPVFAACVKGAVWIAAAHGALTAEIRM